MPSMLKLSFAMSARGLPLVFLGPGAFFCFGGVSASSDSSSPSGSLSISTSEFSSSESSLRFFFFGAAFAFGFGGCDGSFGGRPRGLPAAAGFLGAAAFGLAALTGLTGAKSELSPSSKTESMRESSMATRGQLASPAGQKEG